MQTESDPIDLAAAKAARDLAETEAAKLREQEVSDFRWVVQDGRGRRFIWRLMREARVFHSSFSAEALTMAHHEGQREQGLKLLNELLELCPEKWLEMINDQKRR